MSVRRALTISLDPYAAHWVRVVVLPPWGIGGCDDTPTTCALLDLSLIGNNVFVISASLEAGPVNVVIEASDDENVLSCPP